MSKKAKSMVGQLVQLPIDKCIGVVVEESNWIWGNQYKVMPIEDTVFYIKGELESVMKDQVKTVKHKVEKIRKAKNKKKV